ncbi:hypothetical protein ASPWEDRAFT_22869 [Aspergillus wentii DTO 134E9]|uniref:Gfo/Idh/MocA-like oxidoreductase N-terminal domain-containing protein n=1 Tax=Aspergillus wentii DTO 134E9 TaxID=1073089 RepID=A0A1L9S0M2_ASPWE|nr:uncharacterized protein ASPWEDRAFT_22869 [Aspergillus wentii DTO 134E9]KAI9931275.1 hypothetical protein MW887_010937 [Aspergillus wentii]OJJ40712.1 hypothetical protein ASPWEDRAFT_22869 [Aspergillus wentii DTO 134E9]
MPENTLRIGILGANSEPIQTIYLPILKSLKDHYQLILLHDPSSSPSSPTTTTKTTQSTTDLLTNPSINLLLNFLPLSSRESYTIAALEAGKNVLVQPPLSPSIQGAKRILDAEKTRAKDGARVFVSCVRRHATCFETFQREVASLDRIYYARCRNIAGPGMLGLKDFPPVKSATNGGHILNGNGGGRSCRSDGVEDTTPNDLLHEVFDERDLTQARLSLYNFLYSLGCHDLALLRETMGIPDAISSISINDPFYSAIFHYNDSRANGNEDTHRPFTLVYETGADAIPRCDAHLAVYGQSKTVTIQYDLPYAPNQPVRVIVEERDGENGQVMRRESECSWEETYRAELTALHACLVDGESVKMTTASDGLTDLKLFRRMFEQYGRQCGTIRTPLG